MRCHVWSAFRCSGREPSKECRQRVSAAPDGNSPAPTIVGGSTPDVALSPIRGLIGDSGRLLCTDFRAALLHRETDSGLFARRSCRGEALIVALTPPVLQAAMPAARILPPRRLLRLARGLVAVRRACSPPGGAARGDHGSPSRADRRCSIRGRRGGPAPSAWDGTCWAVCTVTSAGDARVGPTTDGGRILALAMITGIGWLPIVTGSVPERSLAASRQAQREERHVVDEVPALRARIEQLEA